MKGISAEEYRITLLKSRIIENDTYRSILVAQYAAPSGKVTANQLAKLLNFNHWGTVNLRYGEIGHKISNTLGVLQPKRNDGKYWWWNILSDGKQTDQGFIWTLWPTLAQALESLGVVASYEASLPEEIDLTFLEGASTNVTVNRYEKNAVARRY